MITCSIKSRTSNNFSSIVLPVKVLCCSDLTKQDKTAAAAVEEEEEY